ncbi:2-hydroxychromene-2-carboxylate isomerase [Lacimicrobium sp. SS2-24]|uniref:2-hydroxychromene-2-carboxylate isomerase n=1 Tax=Lacimicrobium sp. SS2-24 TaxID=2005569 RepID=UPI000B4A76AD|nr:2-hydroxychromene-2-carboxylate isomerase [Lacimicrobium sp. SS2-24]
MEIDFWFDFSSPYCYPAALELEQQAQRHQVTINWYACVLGTSHKARTGTAPLAQPEAPEQAYTWLDMKRVCGEYGLSFYPPSRHWQGVRLATRIACWYRDSDWITDFIHSVFAAGYAQDRNIADEKVLADCIALAGQDPLVVMDQANSMEARARLHLQNQQAIRAGVFEAPFFHVQQEPFAGLHRLSMAVARAGELSRRYSVA